MAEKKTEERLEGSLTDGGSLPGEDERSFGGEQQKEGGKLPGEADASTQRGRDLPDGGYEPPTQATGEDQPSRGYGG